jgi:hypothetical protein
MIRFIVRLTRILLRKYSVKDLSSGCGIWDALVILHPWSYRFLATFPKLRSVMPLTASYKCVKLKP